MHCFVPLRMPPPPLSKGGRSNPSVSSSGFSVRRGFLRTSSQPFDRLAGTNTRSMSDLRCGRVTSQMWSCDVTEIGRALLISAYNFEYRQLARPRGGGSKQICSVCTRTIDPLPILKPVAGASFPEVIVCEHPRSVVARKRHVRNVERANVACPCHFIPPGRPPYGCVCVCERERVGVGGERGKKPCTATAVAIHYSDTLQRYTTVT